MKERLSHSLARAASAALLLGALTACGGREGNQVPATAPAIGSSSEFTPSPVLESYISTLPRSYGNVSWNGIWHYGPSISGAASIEAYYEGEILRHRVLSVLIPTLDKKGNPLSVEQQKVIAKKESFGTMCAYNHIDSKLLQSLTEEEIQKAGDELDILADGLAVLALTQEEQNLLNVGYTEPKFNYKADGTPFFGDPFNPGESIIKGQIEWDCESPVTPAMIAAVHIMSEGQGSINSGGIENIGPILIHKYHNQ